MSTSGRSAGGKRGTGRRPLSTRRGAPMSSAPLAEPLMAPATPTARDWRTEVVVASSVNIVAGSWLVVAPFVTGYTAADAAWNPILCGAVVLVLAVVRAYQPGARTIGLSAVNAVVGAWLFASAFWLGQSAVAITVVWITGLVVFCVAVSSGVSSTHNRSGRK